VQLDAVVDVGLMLFVLSREAREPRLTPLLQLDDSVFELRVNFLDAI
jgi:hypothetical protein